MGLNRKIVRMLEAKFNEAITDSRRMRKREYDNESLKKLTRFRISKQEAKYILKHYR